MWTEVEIQQALNDNEAGKSIRSVSKKCGMSASGLSKRLLMRKQQKELVGSGRRPTLTEDEEKALAKCVGTMCQLGFNPTRNQIRDMVQEFVQ